MRAYVLGASEALALRGAESILTHFAGNKKAIIRARPAAETVKDFATDTAEHRGYVRFHFASEAGDWSYIDQTYPDNAPLVYSDGL